MRKICLALCLSLFASLIHAAVMPIELSPGNAHHQVAVVEASSHHCDEMASATQDTATNQSCHGDNYQCCLGLVLTPSLGPVQGSDFSEIQISEYPSLALQPMISFIYKPPKA